MKQRHTTPERELLIAALASADPRTVRKVLRGERVRGGVEARIRNALEALAELESPAATTHQ